jgi:uncharacterized membrane protein YfcA
VEVLIELLLILTVMAFAFFVKSVVGFGGPLLATPLLAPFLGVEHAVVVVSLANILSNLMILWGNRSAAGATRALLVRMILAGVVGAVVGSYFLTILDDRILSAVLAGSVLSYIVLALSRPELHIDRDTGMRIAAPAGAVGGLIHGATGNSGIVFGTFLHALALPRTEFLFAVTIPFLVFGSVQVVTLASLGSFTADRTLQALLAILPVLVVTPIGTRIGARLASRTFSRLVLTLLGGSGLVLLISAIRG